MEEKKNQNVHIISSYGASTRAKSEQKESAVQPALTEQTPKTQPAEQPVQPVKKFTPTIIIAIILLILTVIFLIIEIVYGIYASRTASEQTESTETEEYTESSNPLAENVTISKVSSRSIYLSEDLEELPDKGQYVYAECTNGNDIACAIQAVFEVSGYENANIVTATWILDAGETRNIAMCIFDANMTFTGQAVITDVTDYETYTVDDSTLKSTKVLPIDAVDVAIDSDGNGGAEITFSIINDTDDDWSYADIYCNLWYNDILLLPGNYEFATDSVIAGETAVTSANLELSDDMIDENGKKITDLTSGLYVEIGNVIYLPHYEFELPEREEETENSEITEEEETKQVTSDIDLFNSSHPGFYYNDVFYELGTFTLRDLQNAGFKFTDDTDLTKKIDYLSFEYFDIDTGKADELITVRAATTSTEEQDCLDCPVTEIQITSSDESNVETTLSAMGMKLTFDCDLTEEKVQTTCGEPDNTSMYESDSSDYFTHMYIYDDPNDINIFVQLTFTKNGLDGVGLYKMLE